MRECFRSFLSKKQIKQQFIFIRTPEHNGKVEYGHQIE